MACLYSHYYQRLKNLKKYIYTSLSTIFMEIKNQRLLVSPFALDQAHLPQRTEKGSFQTLPLSSVPPSGEIKDSN